MAVFKRKKNTPQTQEKQATMQADHTVRNVLKNKPLSSILKNPRITEKATMLTGGRVYTFDVQINATKIDVKRAVKAFYDVEPVKVRMIRIPRKQVRSRRTRGVVGTKGGGKKALVYLKEGDSIDFV